ncbi:hypothetical protein OS493_011118 [Desmophyllum pertusum]|uniref:Uncharacterized protein n=1 Tax=Desmophyllum pertusum TaxID=174260 RepID=A0A9W9Z1B2_9CNID|nr:hypothetical protein OS493_011118 [Desmophyllum pertusum]
MRETVRFIPLVVSHDQPSPHGSPPGETESECLAFQEYQFRAPSVESVFKVFFLIRRFSA